MVLEFRLYYLNYTGPFSQIEAPLFQRRLFWEVPVLVQRLCGICPVSLRAVDAVGRNRLLDDIDYQTYTEHIAEEVRDWSYMKFPFLKAVGPENGWYRVDENDQVVMANLIVSTTQISNIFFSSGAINDSFFCLLWVVETIRFAMTIWSFSSTL